MSWSLNEIDSLARKATRGAGYSWGLAEEAGRATRWLCAMGLPGADCLAGVLEQTDGVDYATLCPTALDGPWQANGGTLCPLIAGSSLCDHARALADGMTISLQKTAYPLLLYPHVAAASDMTGAALTLFWGSTKMTRCDGESYLVDLGARPDPTCEAATVAPATGTPSGQRVKRAWRGQINGDTARILGALAHRTYAPDTPESRLGGAGAGLTDND